MVVPTVKSQTTISAQITELIYETDTTINYPYKHFPPGYIIKSYQIYNTSDAALRKRELGLIQNLYDSLISGIISVGQNISNHSLVANGNYIQDWNKNQLKFNNISHAFINSQDSVMISFNSTGGRVIALKGDSVGKRTWIGQYNNGGFGRYGVSIINTTGEVMIDSAYYLPTTAAGAIDEVLTSTSTYGTAWQLINHIGLVTKYNSSNTAGNGLFVIRAHADYTGQTSSITVTSFTPPINGSYVITGYLNPSANTGSTSLKISFTDQSGNPQVYTLASALSSATGVQTENNVEIQALGGSAINVFTSIGSGSITYDVSSTVTQTN